MRESGYYRVILNKDYGWEIAVYNAETKAWHVCGIDNGHSDSDFEAIDENRIDPEPEVTIGDYVAVLTTKSAPSETIGLKGHVVSIGENCYGVKFDRKIGFCDTWYFNKEQLKKA